MLFEKQIHFMKDKIHIRSFERTFEALALYHHEDNARSFSIHKIQYLLVIHLINSEMLALIHTE